MRAGSATGSDPPMVLKEGIYVFLGPPGAGKGTVAARLAAEEGAQHLSTGDVLRRAVKDGTEVGKAAASYMKAGKLVPDDLMIDVLFAAVPDLGRGCLILDGFPRTLPQAEVLADRLAAKDLGVARCVFFAIEDREIVSRLASRLVCKACGATYNARSRPPARAGVCDACGGAVGRRSDDEEAAVRERLRVYRETTAPLVDHYRGLGLLVTVDAGRPMEAVYSDVRELLRGRA